MKEKNKQELNINLSESLHSSIKLGANWLIKVQKSDGEFKDCSSELSAYYKAPLMFSACGYIEAGTLCLKFIEENLRNERGELCSGTIKTNFPRLQRNLANYIDGWVAIGSWRLGAYSFSEQICSNLKQYQNSTHGGIATGPEKWAGRLRYDLATAASCGRAFLISGYRKEAFAAANFLVEALNHQIDLDTGLNLCFDEDWKIINSPYPSERTYYRLDLNSIGEKIWFPAFSSAFLCEAYQVSKNNSYLIGAKEYFNTITNIIEFKEGSLANGKSGWSAGLLALITKEKQYLSAIKMIVPNVLRRQRKNGEFGPSPRSIAARGSSSNINRKKTNTPLPRTLETTAEFTTWCAEFLRLYTLGLWK